MATSGTATFNLDINEICEESFERAGLEMRYGYDLKTARRSLNLMCLEWQNRGINLWTVEEGSVTLVAGTLSYTLPADTIDLMDHVLRTDSGESNQSDFNLSRISATTYSQIPAKLTEARPTQLYIDRQKLIFGLIFLLTVVTSCTRTPKAISLNETEEKAKQDILKIEEKMITIIKKQSGCYFLSHRLEPIILLTWQLKI